MYVCISVYDTLQNEINMQNYVYVMLAVTFS